MSTITRVLRRQHVGTTSSQKLSATSIWNLAFAGFAWVDHVLQVRRERAMLARLDDRMLKDIGLSRGQAYREVSRGLADVPEPQMRNRKRIGYAAYRMA